MLILGFVPLNTTKIKQVFIFTKLFALFFSWGAFFLPPRVPGHMFFCLIAISNPKR